MDAEMESHPTPAKRPRISMEESAVDHPKQAEMEASHQKRWLCNELVWEMCKDIPSAKTSDSILLTAHKIYAYLEPRFSNKVIYRDAIAFLRAKLKAKENVRIRIDQMVHNNESEPVLALKQKQSDKKFKLETNRSHVQIWTVEAPFARVLCVIFVGQFEDRHLQYFLRLIAPLLHPIQLSLNDCLSSIPVDGLVRFLNTQSEWIDSIKLWDDQFNSEPIYGALSKYNKLQIDGTTVDVPKLVHWLTSNNNNGQLKYLFNCAIYDGQARLIKKLKKEFIRATSKSRFVVRVEFYEQLDEFTLRNELTGEKLQLRRKNVGDGPFFTHALSRFSNNEMDDNENDFAELDTFMTRIYLC